MHTMKETEMAKKVARHQIEEAEESRWKAVEVHSCLAG